MLTSSSKLEGHSAKEASEEAKASLASKGSTISSGRDLGVPDKATHSAIYSRSSRKCSEAAVARGGHKGDRSNMPKVKT